MRGPVKGPLIICWSLGDSNYNLLSGQGFRIPDWTDEKGKQQAS